MSRRNDGVVAQDEPRWDGDPVALEDSIARGISYLQRRQRPSGAFTVYLSPDPAFKTYCTDDRTPFGAALIAYSLGFSRSAAARAVLDRAADFFLAEMTGPGVWRYWTRDHPYYRNIPPDVDDLACISIALRRHGVNFPDNRSIVLANRNSGGLFHTWIIPRLRPILSLNYWRATLPQLMRPIRYLLFWKLFASKPNDVDGIVNANVLFYLGDTAATRPVVDYLVEILQRGEEGCCDKWHCNQFTFYYTLSRNYEAGIAGLDLARDIIIERVTQALNADVGALNAALGACALMNCGASPFELTRAVQSLIATQGAEGEWPATPLYYSSPAKDGCFGSEELTTGFCVETLVRYLDKLQSVTDVQLVERRSATTPTLARR